MTLTSCYRALLRLYPARFRRDYGDAMVALFADQLRDESTVRVCGRAALDLAVTVPTRHLEARMNRSSTPLIVAPFLALGAALAVVGGPVGLAAGLGALALAVVSWRRSRPVVAPGEGRWWRLLLAGVILLGSLIGVTTVTGELPSGLWYAAMVCMLVSFVLIAAGLMLAVVELAGRRTAPTR